MGMVCGCAVNQSGMTQWNFEAYHGQFLMLTYNKGRPAHRADFWTACILGHFGDIYNERGRACSSQSIRAQSCGSCRLQAVLEGRKTFEKERRHRCPERNTVDRPERMVEPAAPRARIPIHRGRHR